MLTNLRFIQSKFWLLNNYLIENIRWAYTRFALN